jgi:hypothetical protein
MAMLGHTKISGEGLVYPLEADGLRLEVLVSEVLVSLNDDGQGWRVRFDVGGSQYGGNGKDPLEAFQVAADLARGALSGQGIRLDIEGIKKVLVEDDALDAERKLTLPLSALAALGIQHAYPQQIEAEVVDTCLRESDFLLRTEGLRSPHWHVVGVAWKDFGREVQVAVRLGR